ncbi:hypothetical protein SpiGrapes_3126 [Sphaerochaeta pleomorpha str. Grapes]|uniref:Uncharacterized protein n=1 Tax=Sphaerochaeta pleomorpha (strain ATCC BAA-1885 / DSM 22778 / Grapes) TaxID=158190 RepID=G8QZ14_SPHPG|nr:hypothetical protein [Sphaerochaeta pleomorpha]AEV30873.1 hypothetical protein SpiGrapes_3126 [Sphaerochaeta pleomorpha str. Grapes]
MKRRIVVLIVMTLLFFVFIGCDDSLGGFASILNTEQLTDSRFNGNFTFFEHWTDSYGINERYEYTSYNFDGTNKVHYYTKYYSYSTSSGWHYSGDYIGDYYSWDLEFEIQNGQYRTRLWNNKYSDWEEWEDYEFSGNTLTLHNKYNISGNDEILAKH